MLSALGAECGRSNAPNATTTTADVDDESKCARATRRFSLTLTHTHSALSPNVGPLPHSDFRFAFTEQTVFFQSASLPLLLLLLSLFHSLRLCLCNVCDGVNVNWE